LVVQPGGALEALEALNEQGVIRGIGQAESSHDIHRRAIETVRFYAIHTYNDYHPIRTTALAGGLLQLAEANDVGVLNGSPLAHGLLIGEEPARLVREGRIRPPERDLDAARRLYRWCRENDVPMVAVILQFCIRQPLVHCTLSGAKTPEELDANLRGATLELPEGIWEELEALNLTAGQAQEERTWFPVD
ncbi:MAG: aldo/keto reductase, partial [Armatimonadetes bacterium]|nr:aldo/keto reductase [Armatimonadota bacterium]